MTVVALSGVCCSTITRQWHWLYCFVFATEFPLELSPEYGAGRRTRQHLRAVDAQHTPKHLISFRANLLPRSWCAPRKAKLEPRRRVWRGFPRSHRNVSMFKGTWKTGGRECLAPTPTAQFNLLCLASASIEKTQLSTWIRKLDPIT